MKLQILTDTYALSIAGGTAIGGFFGDEVFPVVETAFGDPFADIFFALLGAAAAALIHEIADEIRH
jgi:hypothetical protein